MVGGRREKSEGRRGYPSRRCFSLLPSPFSLAGLGALEPVLDHVLLAALELVEADLARAAVVVGGEGDAGGEAEERVVLDRLVAFLGVLAADLVFVAGGLDAGAHQGDVVYAAQVVDGVAELRRVDRLAGLGVELLHLDERLRLVGDERRELQAEGALGGGAGGGVVAVARAPDEG